MGLLEGRWLTPQPPACLSSEGQTYSVERACRVSKAPGEMVAIWLSYSERRRTLRRPVKLSLWMQLMRLFLSILGGRAERRAAPTLCPPASCLHCALAATHQLTALLRGH